MIIRFFDWRGQYGSCVAASTTNDENNIDCYCSERDNPLNWWCWDVSILRLPDDEAHKLAVKLSRLWAIMHDMEDNSSVR